MDLWRWPIENSHVIYSAELHWRMAAKWNNMTFEQFLAQDGEEQSRMVAAYETSQMIDAVVSTDAGRKVKRQNKKRR